MKIYEALIIFAESVKDDTVNEAMDMFQAEIERQGGKIEEKTVLGRRSFARPLQKRDSGIYGKALLQLAPDKIAPLKQRCKFVDALFRVQITIPPKRRRKNLAEPAPEPVKEA